MKFSAVLLFMVIWFTFSYLPMAHMVWYWDGPDAIKDEATLETVTANAAGWLWAKGALDFAGGTVVHINAGVAGLVAAYVLGKRIGYGKEAMAPHSLTLTMVGAALLWVGWFGFNAGSNLEANGVAAFAFVNTLLRHRRARCSPGRSPSGCSRASPRCWVRPRVRWPAWSRSRRHAASSASAARSSSASPRACCACGV